MLLLRGECFLQTREQRIRNGLNRSAIELQAFHTSGRKAFGSHQANSDTEFLCLIGADHVIGLTSGYTVSAQAINDILKHFSLCHGGIPPDRIHLERESVRCFREALSGFR
jgi:hypothetical protein